MEKNNKKKSYRMLWARCFLACWAEVAVTAGAVCEAGRLHASVTACHQRGGHPQQGCQEQGCLREPSASCLSVVLFLSWGQLCAAKLFIHGNCHSPSESAWRYSIFRGRDVPCSMPRSPLPSPQGGSPAEVLYRDPQSGALWGSVSVAAFCCWAGCSSDVLPITPACGSQPIRKRGCLGVQMWTWKPKMSVSWPWHN